MRSPRLRPARAAVLVTTAVLALLAPLLPAAADPAADPAANPSVAPRVAGQAAATGTVPLLQRRGSADPTVVQVGSSWVMLATGRGVPRATAPSPNGPWTDIAAALLTLPSWASDDRIWASDLVRTDTQWVLYFSAPVAGLGSDGRCIGAAVANSPLDAFTPVERPLVCPRGAAAPGAWDRVRPLADSLPRGGGVIDPEGWTDRDGQRWLLYRTQGQPSSIRMVRLPDTGLPGTGRQKSLELARSRGVIENPVLVQRGKRIVLLTSQGPFTTCRYETTWRKARTLEALAKARKRVLISSRSSGLCGPGGADLAIGTGDSLLFLHAWHCRDLGGPCPAGADYDVSPVLGSVRAMYGANLAWSPKGTPRITGWLSPVTDPATGAYLN